MLKCTDINLSGQGASPPVFNTLKTGRLAPYRYHPHVPQGQITIHRPHAPARARVRSYQLPTTNYQHRKALDICR